MTRAATTRPGSDRPSAPRPRSGPVPQGIDPVRVLRQHMVLLVVTLIVGCGLGVGAHFAFARFYPLYYGEVRFQLKDKVVDPKDVIATGSATEDEVVRQAQTEAARITSRDTLTDAMRSSDVRKTTWSEGFRDGSGNFVVDDAVDELIDDLRAGHRRGTQIFFISWRAHDADDVPVVLNRVADTYIERRRKDDESGYNQRTEVFTKQRDEIDREILNVKKDIADFIGKKGITSYDDKDMRRQEELRKLAEMVQEAKQNLDLATARKSQSQAKLAGSLEPTMEDIRNAEDDPVLLQSKRDLNDARIRLAAIQAKFKPDHPEVRTREKLVQAAEEQMKTTMEQIIKRNINADFKEASDKVEALESLVKRQTDEYSEAAKKLESLASDLTELMSLRERQSQLEEQRKDVAALLTQLALVKAREDSSRVEVVQRSTRPREMDFPNLKVMIPVTALLCMAVVLVFVFAREFLDKRVRFTSDLTSLSDGRLLGVIPDVSDDPTGVKRAECVVHDKPDSITAESYRQTVGQIGKGLEAGHRVFEVLSAMPGGGTTTVVTNLACYAAATGRRTLVLDANFRKPRLASAMGVAADGPGVADILNGKATTKECVRTSPSGIDVLPAGTAGNLVVELLNGPRMDELLAQVRTEYDVILVDGPPAVVAAEALSLANRVDSTILVVRAFRDQKGLVARLAHQLVDVRSTFLGVILNRPRSTAGGYFRANAAAMAGYARKAKA